MLRLRRGLRAEPYSARGFWLLVLFGQCFPLGRHIQLGDANCGLVFSAATRQASALFRYVSGRFLRCHNIALKPQLNGNPAVIRERRGSVAPLYHMQSTTF